MSAPLPPHYRSFRIVLVLVLVVALAGVAWWIAQPGMLDGIFRFLGE
ncbi:MAG: hypothetical protein ACRDRX_20585 [Pseudonocardiaceae bacterium]